MCLIITRRNNLRSHVKGGGQTPLPLDEHAIHVTPMHSFDNSIEVSIAAHVNVYLIILVKMSTYLKYLHATFY